MRNPSNVARPAGKVERNVLALLGVVAVLAYILIRGSSGPGAAVVHATETGAVLSVASRTAIVEDRLQPVVFDRLPAGSHELRMSRGDDLIFSESFEVTGGEQVILSTFKAR